MKKFKLCALDKCPSLIVNKNNVLIGEKENICKLTKKEFQELVKIIKKEF